MNILILCSDIQSKTLACFRAAAGPDMGITVVGTNPWAQSIYEADKWRLLPPGTDLSRAEALLNLCQAEGAACVVALSPDFRRILAEHRECLRRNHIALIASEEALAAHFGGKPELLEACRGCFAEPAPPLGRRIYRSITRHLPLELKLRLSLLPDYLTTYHKNKGIIRNADRRIVYLLDTPTHDNLGDHAIAYAQRRFIRNTLPDAQILELPIPLVDMHLPFIRKHIRPGDIFCMTGGGNFGDTYLMHEHSKRKVCRMFPQNRVIIFPQTIRYSDTPEGRRELALTQAALRPHKKLTITARDLISHQRAREWFPEAECILTPDIVLSLEQVKASVPREHILCCLRRDPERSNAFWAGDVVTCLAAGGYHFKLSDTAGDRRVPLHARTEALQRKWREFCCAELVITDRLHGMIFSCITATPCIVLDNYNHKIRDFYQTWLQELPFVRFAEKPEELLPLIRELMGQPQAHWSSAWLEEAYRPLSDALRKECGR